jgi:hypothetical protein
LLILLGTNQWKKHQLLLLLEQIKIIVHKKIKKGDRKPEREIPIYACIMALSISPWVASAGALQRVWIIYSGPKSWCMEI